MAEKSLTFNLFGKDVSASKAVGEFSEKAHGHISGLIGDLAKLAVGYFGITSVLDFGKSSVEAAMAAQAANEKLDVALKNTHSSITSNSDAVEEQKSKMSDFGFTGEQVSSALTVLTTGLGSSTKALSLMQVTADLAKYKNISLSDSALIVTKGMEGQTRPLKQLGIDLPVYAGNAQQVALANDKVAKAQQGVNDLLAKYPGAADAASKHHDAYVAAVKRLTDAQQLANDKSSSGQQIIDALSQKLNGQAAKAADTYAGKWAAVSAKWDEIQVKAGTVILPALGAVSDFLNKHLLPDLENLGKSKGPEKMAKDLATALGWKGSDSAGPLSGNAWANGWDQLMGKFGNGWDQWVAKFGHGAAQYSDHGPYNTNAWANGWDQLMGKFGNGWDQWMAKFGNGAKQWQDKFSNGMDQIKSSFSNGWSQITAAFSHGASQIGSAFASQWAGIKSGWDNVVGSFQNGWQQIQDFFSGHPVRAQIIYSNVVPPAPSGGGGGSLVMRPTAHGGLVRARPGGVPLLAGEAGEDEAVLPLNPNVMNDLASRISAAGGGGGHVFNIYEAADPEGTAMSVMRRLNFKGAV